MTTEILRFFVPGQPLPKQRPRLGRHGVYTPTKTLEWENEIGWAAREAMQIAGLGATPCDVHVHMLFQRKGKQRADLDNLIKACLDGMNGIVWIDDRQVRSLSAQVDYGFANGSAGILISISLLT
jgi:Holliday junction resolvase RusA-like endonuclease